MGEGEMEFVDRLLKCCDCSNEFVFTAGEQLFFFDKQFKNDPKRCKLCKAKRAGLGRTATANATGAALPLSRTETRTKCSACAIETTVPFKPTQGRPVLCRSCFQLKRVPSGVAASVAMDSPAERIAEASAALESAIAAGAVGELTPMSVMSGSSATTVEQILDAPSAIVAEATPAASATTELLAAAAEAAHA
jgi:CxxC-x17-CxxC domain-containing protein